MLRYISRRPRHNSVYKGENIVNDDDDNDVCIKWKKFYEYILIEEYPNATLGTYTSKAAEHENKGPKGLFDLSITDCALKWKYKGKTIKEIIKNPKSVFTKDEDIANPYNALYENITNVVAPDGSDKIACREMNGGGTYCDTSPGSKTDGRRAAAWGCGIGMLFGMDELGQCNPYFDYDGLKDDFEDMLYILDEFQSLSFLCAGQIISAFQCRLLENFSTQHSIYKTLLIKRKQLLDQKLYPLQLRVTCVVIITFILLMFIAKIRIFK